MKIAITADPAIPVPPELYGGIERIVYLLVHGLINLGHDVTLFAHPDSKVSCKLVKWKGLGSNNLFDTIKNAATLYLKVKQEGYDIVHSFSRLAYLTPILPMTVPKIMSYQREPTLGQIAKATRLAKKRSLFFTGCSNYITDQIKSVADATTVYNCVRKGSYDLTEVVPVNAPLIFLGRIEPIKGTHIAIEVAKKTHKNLIIAGNIPHEGMGYFEKEIKPHLCDRIKYVGAINDQQKNELLGQALGFLMPIQWNEPFGIVMAEAMFCGTPVIGFPFGSVPEVIEDGRNGFICKDVEEMISKVGELETISRKKVRSIAEKRFSDTTIIAQYLKIYEKLSGKIVYFPK